MHFRASALILLIHLGTYNTAFAIMPPYKRAQLSACQMSLGHHYDVQLSPEDSFNYIKSTIRFKGQPLSDEEANSLNSVLSSYFGGHLLKNFTILKGEFETLVHLFEPISVSQAGELTRLLQNVSHKLEIKTQYLHFMGLIKSKLQPKIIFENQPELLMQLYTQIVRVSGLSEATLNEVILDLNSIYKISGPALFQEVTYKIESDYNIRVFNEFVKKNYILFSEDSEKVHLQSVINVYSNAFQVPLSKILEQIEDHYGRASTPILASHLIEYYDVYSEPIFSSYLQ